MANTRLLKLLDFIKQQPEDLFLKYALAMEYLGINEIVHAKTYFEDVISKDPDYVAAYYQLGKIYEGMGEEEKAIVLFERGIEAAKVRQDARAEREMKAALDELMF